MINFRSTFQSFLIVSAVLISFTCAPSNPQLLALCNETMIHYFDSIYATPIQCVKIAMYKYVLLGISPNITDDIAEYTAKFFNHIETGNIDIPAVYCDNLTKDLPNNRVEMQRCMGEIFEYTPVHSHFNKDEKKANLNLIGTTSQNSILNSGGSLMSSNQSTPAIIKRSISLNNQSNVRRSLFSEDNLMYSSKKFLKSNSKNELDKKHSNWTPLKQNYSEPMNNSYYTTPGFHHNSSPNNGSNVKKSVANNNIYSPNKVQKNNLNSKNTKYHNSTSSKQYYSKNTLLEIMVFTKYN